MENKVKGTFWDIDEYKKAPCFVIFLNHEQLKEWNNTRLDLTGQIWLEWTGLNFSLADLADCVCKFKCQLNWLWWLDDIVMSCHIVIV